MLDQPLISLFVLAAISLIPFVLMSATSFAKISVVFSILRNALGTGQVPSGPIIAALAAALTFFVMMPVGEEIYGVAGAEIARLNPKENKEIPYQALFDAVDKGKEPFRQWLVRNAGTRELTLFRKLYQERKKERAERRRAKKRYNSERGGR